MSAPLPLTRVLIIQNARGLHARASAKFVKTASQFEADIMVSRDGMTVSARSIMGLLTLGAAQGCTIEVTATGDDADAALDALATLIALKFHEEA